MRVLVSTTAGSGHFGPLVPFARACAAAGHAVAVAAPASFAADVAAGGFEHLPFDDASPELIGRVFERVASLSYHEANAVVIGDVFGRLDARAAWPGLVEIVENWRPDLVLREPCEFGSLVAARTAGVPQVVGAIGVEATNDYIRPLVAEPLAELDDLAGLPQGTAAAVMAESPTVTCVPAVLDRAVGPGPDRGAPAPTHRFHDRSLVSAHGALPEPWGEQANPLVYLSFGSVAARMSQFAPLYPAVLAAFADLPVRVLLTTGHGIDPGDLPAPANARIERWWPQADVMSHASVAVGHGGFGTTMGALAAGVPQVVLPLFASDQRINAEHVAAVGAGLHVEGGLESVDALPGAVAELLAVPQHREAARAVAEEMAALSPVDDVVPLLERIAASSGSNAESTDERPRQDSNLRPTD